MRRIILISSLAIFHLVNAYAQRINYTDKPQDEDAFKFYDAAVNVHIQFTSHKGIPIPEQCSGTLVKPTLRSQRAYLITAAHCIIKTEVAKREPNMEVYKSIGNTQIDHLEISKYATLPAMIKIYEQLSNKDVDEKILDNVSQLSDLYTPNETNYSMYFNDSIAIPIFEAKNPKLFAAAVSYGINFSDIEKSRLNISKIYDCSPTVFDQIQKEGWKEWTKGINEYRKDYCEKEENQRYVFGNPRNGGYIQNSLSVISYTENDMSIEPELQYLNHINNKQTGINIGVFPNPDKIDMSNVTSDPNYNTMYKICNFEHSKANETCDGYQFDLEGKGLGQRLMMNWNIAVGKTSEIIGGDSGGAIVLCNETNKNCKYVGHVTRSSIDKSWDLYLSSAIHK